MRRVRSPAWGAYSRATAAPRAAPATNQIILSPLSCAILSFYRRSHSRRRNGKKRRHHCLFSVRFQSLCSLSSLNFSGDHRTRARSCGQPLHGQRKIDYAGSVATSTIATPPSRTGFDAKRAVKGFALLVAVYLVVVYLIPKPAAVKPEGWRLTGIFLATIVGSVVEPIPAGALVLIAITLTAVSRSLTTQQ